MEWPRRTGEDEQTRAQGVPTGEGVPAEAWEEATDEPPLPKLGWQDILAMTIAAYQIIFPIIFLFFGVMLVIYFLLRWVLL